MRRLTILLAVWLALTVACAPARAQTPDPRLILTTAAEAVAAQDAGDHQRATELFRTVFDMIAPLAQPNDPNLALLQARWSESLSLLGRYDPALEQAQAAVAALENTGMAQSPGAAWAYDSRGRALSGLTRYADAEIDYRRALAVVEVTGGSKPNHRAVALNNLAFVLDQQGKYRQAATFYALAIGAEEALPDPDRVSLARSRVNLAATLGGLEALDDAQMQLDLAIPILMEALGPDHHDVLIALRLEGQLMSARDAHEAAAQRLRVVAAAVEAAKGPEHPDTALALQLLAYSTARNGELGEAEALYRRALAIDASRRSADHPLQLARAVGMANTIQAQDRDEEALSALRHASGLLAGRLSGSPLDSARRSQDGRLYRAVFNMLVQAAWAVAQREE